MDSLEELGWPRVWVNECYTLSTIQDSYSIMNLESSIHHNPPEHDINSNMFTVDIHIFSKRPFEHFPKYTLSLFPVQIPKTSASILVVTRRLFGWRGRRRYVPCFPHCLIAERSDGVQSMAYCRTTRDSIRQRKNARRRSVYPRPHVTKPRHREADTRPGWKLVVSSVYEKKNANSFCTTPIRIGRLFSVTKAGQSIDTVPNKTNQQMMAVN